MTTLLVIALLAFGGAQMFGKDKALALISSLRSKFPAVTTGQLIGAAMIVVAVAVLFADRFSEAEPSPTPAPGPTAPLNLKGRFNGPTAAADAAIIGCICDELASIIEFDVTTNAGKKFQTAAQVDEWRRTMREFRCRGESVGARQPAARDAIAEFMLNTVGDAPGDLTPESRSAWIGALRDIGRACNDAAR